MEFLYLYPIKNTQLYKCLREVKEDKIKNLYTVLKELLYVICTAPNILLLFGFFSIPNEVDFVSTFQQIFLSIRILIHEVCCTDTVSDHFSNKEGYFTFHHLCIL